MAGLVAALSRAAGTALDPSSILSRTMAVLEPAIDLGRVSLWRSTADGMELVATRPSAERELGRLDLDATALSIVPEHAALRQTLPLEGIRVSHIEHTLKALATLTVQMQDVSTLDDADIDIPYAYLFR